MADIRDITGRKLVIACGGTGGHLFPGIAVAEEWEQRGGKALLLISEKQIDALASEGHGHLRFERMPAVAMPGLSSPRMPAFLYAFVKGLLRCRALIRDFGADAVLGMGGFTSTAPLVAGWMRRLPTFIHDSNAIPGRANKLNARFARSVLVGFAECAPHFGGARVETVGTPLRPKVVVRPSREEAMEFFGLDPSRKTLMVMGGSQGAQRINELVAAGLERFGKAGLQVLHLTGPQDHESVAAAYAEHPEAGVALPFCSEVQFAYAAADLAVVRSGASCLTEIAFYETPAILVPYPHAADDHQTANAKIFSGPGAAELWPQGQLSEEDFADRVVALATDADRLAEMKKRMAELAIPDASARVCDVVAADC